MSLLFSWLLTSPVHAETLTLLVAVSDYGEHLPRLGAEQDARLLKAALIRRGVPADNITVLLDSNATRDGVTQSLSQLQSQARRGDHLLIHFSGHGRQIPDDSGDESDGLDEALLLSGQTLLRDDELGVVLTALRRTVGEHGSVAVTLDACSAGTITRSQELPTRGMSGGGRSVPLLDEAAGAPGALVVLSATGPGGKAHEVYGPDGVVSGAFSTALAEALASPRPGQTWQALFARLRATLSASARGQRPLLEGSMYAPVLGGSAQAPQASVMVTGVLSDGRVRLGGGLMHGIAPGATIEFHAPEAARPTSETREAVGTVLEATSTSALVTLHTPAKRSTLLSGRGFVVGAVYTPTMLRIRLELPPALTETWADFLNAEPLLIRSERAADYVLFEQDDVVMLRAAIEAEALMRSPEPPEESPLSEWLRTRAAAHLVDTLQLDHAHYAIESRLMIAEPKRCEIRSAAADNSIFSPQDTIRLQVQSHGIAPAYITILHQDATGAVVQLYPTPGMLPPRLAPGDTWDVPTCWSPTAPFGMERLKILATRAPVDLSTILPSSRSLRGNPIQDGYSVDLNLTTAPNP
ncbi:MAG: hypothetical protein ACI8RZ_003261 [Myxococcota bacterium]|jgi:hypothetical protein